MREKCSTYLSDETVGAGEVGVDASANADEPAGHSVLERVGLGLKREHVRVDRQALGLVVRVTGDETYEKH